MSRQSSSEQQPRRVKVTLACIVCRKKKVKCDGVQPSCSRCKNSGTHCEYSDRPRKRGPPKGYVEVIENRAHRIETLLGNKKIDPRYVSSSPPTAAIASPTTAAPASSSSCANEIQKLVADAVCTVEVKLSSIQASLPGSQGSVCDSSPVEIDDWCDKFFKHFNVLFPILSKPHFMHQIEQDQIDPRLRCAVYAVGCRYANPREQSGKIWFDKCLDMLSSCSHDSILTVQALAIICWYAYLIGDLQKCCALQQKLAQAVQNANLAQESAGHIVDQEMARRAFWVSVVIDQWLAVCTGHRFLTCKANVKQPHLEDSQLSAIDSRKLQLHQQSSPPKHEDDLSVESALQVAAFSEMIKLSNIVGQAHYAAADSSLETALTAWLLSLPPYLEYGSKSSTDGSPPSAVARIFHILYYTVQILLHRDRRSDPFSSICTTAANTIVHISEQMLHDSQDRYLHNVFGLALTLASSIHLRDARASKNTHNSLPAEINLGKSLRILKDANCTVLLQVDFDRLLHRFLVGRCGIVIDGHHDNASSQHHHAPTRTVTNNMKRPCVVDDLERAVKRPSFDFSRWLPPEMMQETQRLSTPAHHEAPSMSTGIETTTTTTTTTAAAAVAATSSPALCMADLLAEPCYWLQHEFQPSPHSPSITTTGALTNSPEISTPAGSSYHSSLDLFQKEFDNVYTFCAPDLLNEFI